MKIRVLVFLVLAAELMFMHPDVYAQKNGTKPSTGQGTATTVVPVIVNGEAQKIAAFENSEDWIKPTQSTMPETDSRSSDEMFDELETAGADLSESARTRWP